MTYNTGNPLGSTDPRDFSDNAENFDDAVNNTASATWTDRFGNKRTTLAGQVGYIGTGTGGAIESYTSGLTLTTYSTIIEYNGEFYRPSASATLPYTTTATLPDADSNLAPVGDATLRQDLANNAASLGAFLVSMEGGPSVEEAVKTRAVYVDDYTALKARTGTETTIVNDTLRGGEFVWVSGDQSVNVDADTYEGVWIESSVTPKTSGAWRRRDTSTLTPEMFGAVGDDSTDTSSEFSAAINWAAENKVRLETKRGAIYLVDDLIVDGYSDFEFACYGTLKRKDNLSDATITRTLKFSNCSNFSVEAITLDGNHINNGATEGGTYSVTNEQRHGLYIDNCSDVYIGDIVGHRACGDTLYITGTDTFNINIKSVYADSYDDLGNYIALGRNPVSIVEGKLINIDSVSVYGVGHETMPGGIDIEPNNGQFVERVTIGTFHCISSGMNPLGIVSSYNSADAVKFVSIGTAYITSLTTGQRRIVNFAGCRNINIDTLRVYGTPETIGLDIGRSGTSQPVYDLNLPDVIVETSYYSALLYNLYDSNIKIDCRDCYSNMLRIYTLDSSNINVTGYFNASAVDEVFCIHLVTTDKVVSNCVFSGNLGLNVVGTVANRAISTQKSNSSLITRVTLRDLDLIDWWDNGNTMMIGEGLRNLNKENCRGLTIIGDVTRSASVIFGQGDQVINSGATEQGTSGSKYVVHRYVVGNNTGTTAATTTFLECRGQTGN